MDILQLTQKRYYRFSELLWFWQVKNPNKTMFDKVFKLRSKILNKGGVK